MCNNITQQNLIMQKNQKQNGEKLKKNYFCRGIHFNSSVPVS